MHRRRELARVPGQIDLVEMIVDTYSILPGHVVMSVNERNLAEQTLCPIKEVFLPGHVGRRECDDDKGGDNEPAPWGCEFGHSVPVTRRV